MVAETKLGFFYLLNVNTMTKYQVGGEGGGGGGAWVGVRNWKTSPIRLS